MEDGVAKKKFDLPIKTWNNKLQKVKVFFNLCMIQYQHLKCQKYQLTERKNSQSSFTAFSLWYGVWKNKLGRYTHTKALEYQK